MSVTVKVDPVMYAVRIGSDVVRVVRRDDYNVAEAVREAFRIVRDDGVNIWMPPDGRLHIVVERVR